MKIGKQKKECCAQCPFARTTSKSYLDTRGDNGAAFVGQAHSNSLLPCHMDSTNGNADPNSGQAQCAGAAKYRANVGVAAELSAALGALPPDHEHVFTTPAELLAHHKGWTLEKAEAALSMVTVDQLAIFEQLKAIKRNRMEMVPFKLDP